MTSLAVTFPDFEQRQLRVVLRATMTAAREARQVIGEIEPLSSYTYLGFVTQLLTAELVGNVLRHAQLAAGDRFELLIDYDADTVRVEVVDPGAGFNPLLLLRRHAANNANHRGIALVNALADRWGFHNHADNCSVWFELDLIPGHRPWNGREPLQQPSLADLRSLATLPWAT